MLDLFFELLLFVSALQQVLAHLLLVVVLFIIAWACVQHLFFKLVRSFK